MVNGGTMSLSEISNPVTMVDTVIGQAIKQKASDILFEPAENLVRVRIRVDGYLQELGDMPQGAYAQVLARIKVLGNMDVAENRKPQEAKIRVDIDGHAYVLRAAIVSTNFGQMLALRVLDMPEFEEFGKLGMNEELVGNLKKNITGRYGMFLVCGPTGSGKTTTVHAALKYLNNGEVNIMTLEDPVEYVMPGINQIEVGSNVGMDFASGLRYILRLDPDVVAVGEIRDSETAKTAIQAALTGHLVISTIHSRNSIGALYRLIDLGADKYMINYALRGILAQRLVRKVCEHCKELYQPTKEEIEVYTKEKGTPPGQLWHGKGCEWCNKTRYHGRVGIYELLEMTEEARQMVTAGTGENEFRTKLIEKGFKSMAHQGLELVDAGVTSIREYIRTMYDAR